MKKIEFVLNCYGTYFELNKEVNNENLNSYLMAIFKENKIDIGNKKDSLLNKEQLIYPGGVTFCEDDKAISTGCCFYINDINKAYKDIINCAPAWLGHDPDTGVVYKENKIMIISDDYDAHEGETATIIEYTKDEIISLFTTTNNNFKEFIEVFYNYLKENYLDIADILYNDLKKNLL